MIRSPKRGVSGSPVSAYASSRRSPMSRRGSRAFRSASARSALAGFTATPRSVTITSTVDPGVVTVRTRSTTIGSLPRSSGVTITVTPAPAAVSMCPPMPWSSTPSDSVLTFTLKSTSTCVAPRIAASSRSTTHPRDEGHAYIAALISRCPGFRERERTASVSKDWTSSSASKSPSSCIATRSPVMPPDAKLPRIFRSRMRSRTAAVAASEIPPAPA